MRATFRLASVLALLLASLTAPARAGTITYDVASLGGDAWRYDYAVTNTRAAPLTWFTVFFSLGDYEALASSVEMAPGGWIANTAQPDPLLPDNGFFDLTTAGPGIAQGETLGGFSIDFRWLGAGTPGSQPFDFIERGPEVEPGIPEMIIVESGVTQPSTPVSVPEPGTLPLLALGLLGLAYCSRRAVRGVAVTDGRPRARPRAEG